MRASSTPGSETLSSRPSVVVGELGAAPEAVDLGDAASAVVVDGLGGDVRAGVRVVAFGDGGANAAEGVVLEAGDAIERIDHRFLAAERVVGVPGDGEVAEGVLRVDRDRGLSAGGVVAESGDEALGRFGLVDPALAVVAGEAAGDHGRGVVVGREGEAGGAVGGGDGGEGHVLEAAGFGDAAGGVVQRVGHAEVGFVALQERVGAGGGTAVVVVRGAGEDPHGVPVRVL